MSKADRNRIAGSLDTITEVQEETAQFGWLPECRWWWMLAAEPLKIGANHPEAVQW